MRVMVFGKATADTEAGVMPTTEQFEAMSDFNRQLMEANILISGEGLKPSSAGKRIKVQGKSCVVTDGPFTETKEVIAGFSIWRVKDMEEAVEWAKKCPNPTSNPIEIELRPLYDYEDFAEVLTLELESQENQFRPPQSDY